MQRWLCKILENEDKIEVFQAVLHALQRCYFNARECDNKEWQVGEVHKTFRGRLHTNTGAVGNAFKWQFSKRNIQLQGFAILKNVRTAWKLMNRDDRLMLRPPRQFSQRRTLFPGWASVVVSFLAVPFQFRPHPHIDVFSSDSLSRRIEHQWLRGKIERPSEIPPKSVSLHNEATSTYEGLFLPDDDRCFEVKVDNYEQFVITRLKEKMFDVAKQDVCVRSSHWSLKSRK